MRKAEVAALRDLLGALSGKLTIAEAGLSRVVAELRACAAEAAGCARLVAELPASGGADPAYAVFIDRRRRALKARINAINLRANSLYTDKKKHRGEVERLLRQKISLEAVLDAEARAIAKRRAEAPCTP